MKKSIITIDENDGTAIITSELGTAHFETISEAIYYCRDNDLECNFLN